MLEGSSDLSAACEPQSASQGVAPRPGAGDWEVWDLEKAMDRVAEPVKKTRDETLIEKLEDGKLANCTTAIFSLGVATLDNEWNHLQQKLMRGLGIVPIENQARI